MLAEALEADYWKPVQAGFDDGTDSERIKSLISNSKTKVFDELYKLKLPASPHIAAREEGITISAEKIYSRYAEIAASGRGLIIEGAGGILVPLNAEEFIIDLIRTINCKVILVSKNYLGSINHSLLTAQLCRNKRIDVAGWIFNDRFMDYEEEIVRWSGYPRICSVPPMKNISKEKIAETAALVKQQILQAL